MHEPAAIATERRRSITTKTTPLAADNSASNNAGTFRPRLDFVSRPRVLIPRFKLFSRPWTLTVLCNVCLCIFLCSKFFGAYNNSMSHDGDYNDVRQNAKRGLMASVAIFLVFAALHFPDGILIRPSLVWWRIAKGLSLLYVMLLAFLLFQNPTYVRKALELIDPALSQSYIEKSYGETCSIYDKNHPSDVWHNLKDKFDVFVLAHFLGWMAKALIIRDWTILWVSSVAFEISEILLRHILPNFVECWCDHIILDVFGCNLFGMYCGMKICEWLKVKKYDWGVRPDMTPRTPSFQLKDAFSPRSWYAYLLMWCVLWSCRKHCNRGTVGKWFSNEIYFLQLVGCCFLLTVYDLNLFFLKAILQLEPGHWICILRTVVTALISAPAVTEINAFAHELRFGRNSLKRRRIGGMDNYPFHKLGAQAWLFAATLVMEIMLIVRWAPAGLPNWNAPCPIQAKILRWVLAGLTVVIYMSLRQQHSLIQEAAFQKTDSGTTASASVPPTKEIVRASSI